MKSVFERIRHQVSFLWYLGNDINRFLAVRSTSAPDEVQTSGNAETSLLQNRYMHYACTEQNSLTVARIQSQSLIMYLAAIRCAIP